MPDEIGVRRDELLERGIDLVEMNIGDEAVDSSIDAGRFRPMQVVVRRDEVRQHLQIREPARIGSGRSVAADALEIVARELNSCALRRPASVKLGCCRSSASRKDGQYRTSFQRE